MRYSGTQLSALAQVEPYEIGHPCSGGNQQLSLALSVTAAKPKPSARKHRSKGSASGWLETRTGNKKRQKPSTSYYYRWDSPKGRITEYIKASKVSSVTRMLDSGKPALEILRYVTAGRKTTGIPTEVLGAVDPLEIVAVAEKSALAVLAIQ